jgi:hypothetical protein
MPVTSVAVVVEVGESAPPLSQLSPMNFWGALGRVRVSPTRGPICLLADTSLVCEPDSILSLLSPSRARDCIEARRKTFLKSSIPPPWA